MASAYEVLKVQRQAPFTKDKSAAQRGAEQETADMTKTYRIECTNNSDARNFSLLDGVSSDVTARHNGGKIVIVTFDAGCGEKVDALLMASPKVANFWDV